MLKNGYFTQGVKYAHILARFGRFLWTGWSDLADFFCNLSGYSRHKFRVPTWPILKRKNFNFILRYTPLEGVCKIFYGGKKILPNGPYVPGNRMRYLRKWNATKRGEWDTMAYVAGRGSSSSGFSMAVTISTTVSPASLALAMGLPVSMCGDSVARNLPLISVVKADRPSSYPVLCSIWIDFLTK